VPSIPRAIIYMVKCRSTLYYSQFSLLFITVLFIVRYCLLHGAGDDG